MNLIKKTLSQNFWFSVINMNAEMVKKSIECKNYLVSNKIILLIIKRNLQKQLQNFRKLSKNIKDKYREKQYRKGNHLEKKKKD